MIEKHFLFSKGLLGLDKIVIQEKFVIFGSLIYMAR